MEPSNILKIYEDILPIKVRHEETNREATKDENKAELTRGGFRGGGGRTPPSPQGFDPLPTRRVPPLILFQKSIFGRPTLKFL